MENEPFYNPVPGRSFDELGRPAASGASEWRYPSHTDPSQAHPRDSRSSESNMYDGQPLKPSQTFEYGHMSERSARWNDEHGDDDGTRWREMQSAAGFEAPARSRYDDYDKQSSTHREYREYDDDTDRKERVRGYAQGAEDTSGRRNRRSKSRDRDRDRDSDRRDRDRYRDRERRSRRDESGYGNERDEAGYRPRRRSRSRDRERSERDRRHRDSDSERRHRGSDSGRSSRRDPDRARSGERETSPKEVPWVPPPLPEHLRHLQFQMALTSGGSSTQPQAGSAPVVLPPIQIPPPTFQNQFQNDGSFMELFRQKMQQQKQGGAAPASVGASLEDSNSNVCPSASASVVGGPAGDVHSTPAVAGPSSSSSTLSANSSGQPVIARRRISKILKTGIVQKKKKEEKQEEEDKDGEGWSSYMKEVQKYRANKCIENEASRPPLVK